MNMNRKSISLTKNTRNKLKRCKQADTERYAEVINRLLDKYENKVINNAKPSKHD